MRDRRKKSALAGRPEEIQPDRARPGGDAAGDCAAPAGQKSRRGAAAPEPPDRPDGETSPGGGEGQPSALEWLRERLPRDALAGWNALCAALPLDGRVMDFVATRQCAGLESALIRLANPMRRLAGYAHDCALPGEAALPPLDALRAELRAAMADIPADAEAIRARAEAEALRRLSASMFGAIVRVVWQENRPADNATVNMLARPGALEAWTSRELRALAHPGARSRAGALRALAEQLTGAAERLAQRGFSPDACRWAGEAAIGAFAGEAATAARLALLFYESDEIQSSGSASLCFSLARGEPAGALPGLFRREAGGRLTCLMEGAARQCDVERAKPPRGDAR